jgi:integrase
LKACLDDGLSVRSVARIYTGIATELRKKQPSGIWTARIRPAIIQQLIDGAWKTFTPPEPQTKRLLPEHIFALGDPRRFNMRRWIESARNRAIIVFGFWAGLRRSDLVNLDVEDLRFFPDRVEVRVRTRKNPVVVWRIWNGPCPVATLEWYLRGARISTGAVFRSMHRGRLRLTDRRLPDKVVALIVKDAVASLGLEPSEYSGDSLCLLTRR